MTNLFNPPKRVDVDLSPYADQTPMPLAVRGKWKPVAKAGVRETFRR